MASWPAVCPNPRKWDPRAGRHWSHRYNRRPATAGRLRVWEHFVLGITYYVLRITYCEFLTAVVVRNTECALALENTSFYSAGQNAPDRRCFLHETASAAPA